ncbi:MAG: hypothetical protein A2V66_14190 [Ignavibacteria bacterium RBG_13_36_8]|nr:MAG: hypothetical protein A2V66_14190 [Ignavibacteria bacterium RBG_13_36_8]
MIEEKIRSFGYEISDLPAPVAMYVPAIKEGNFIFTAGQIPLSDGKVKYTGKIGQDLTEEDGRKASELCVVNCLRVIKSLIKNLDKIEGIIRVNVFVNSTDGFINQSKVANGASDFLVKVFGEVGKHVRSTVGVNELPLNAAVEIDMIAKVKD